MDSAMPAISGGMPSSLMTPRRSSAAPKGKACRQSADKNSTTLCQGAILKSQNTKEGIERAREAERENEKSSLNDAYVHWHTPVRMLARALFWRIKATAPQSTSASARSLER